MPLTRLTRAKLVFTGRGPATSGYARIACLGNYVTIVARLVNKGNLPLIEAKNVRIARAHTHVTPRRLLDADCRAMAPARARHLGSIVGGYATARLLTLAWDVWVNTRDQCNVIGNTRSSSLIGTRDYNATRKTSRDDRRPHRRYRPSRSFDVHKIRNVQSHPRNTQYRCTLKSATRKGRAVGVRNSLAGYLR